MDSVRVSFPASVCLAGFMTSSFWLQPLLSGGAADVRTDDVKPWFIRQLTDQRGRIVLSPLSQEMAVFKSISRASGTSLTSVLAPTLVLHNQEFVDIMVLA